MTVAYIDSVSRNRKIVRGLHPTLPDTRFGIPVNTMAIIRRTTAEFRVISHQAGRDLKYDHPANKGSSTQFRQL